MDYLIDFDTEIVFNDLSSFKENACVKVIVYGANEYQEAVKIALEQLREGVHWDVVSINRIHKEC
jgi:hypothetical protein